MVCWRKRGTCCAIAWISSQKASAPDKPFFAYWAPGAAHAPHHSPKDYADKYKGQFDQGWDKVREETLARQIKLGVVPEGTQLTPRPDSMPAWDDCSADEKKLYARMQEVYAAPYRHTPQAGWHAEAPAELLQGYWWQMLAVTLCMSLLVTAFSLLSDSLRDALDPKVK